MMPLDCGFDKASEQRVGSQRFAFELRMELHGNEPRMVGDFNDFHQAAIWTGAGKSHSVCLELLPIQIVELVSMPMPFIDFIATVGLAGGAVPIKFAGWLPSRIVPPICVTFCCSSSKQITG